MSRSVAALAFCLLLLLPAQLAPRAGAQEELGNAPERGLTRFFQPDPPVVDIRRADPAVRAQVVRDLASPLQERRIEAARELRRTTPGLAIDFDDLTGAPRFIRSRRGPLTAPIEDPPSPRALLNDYILAHSDLFAIDEDSLEDMRLVRQAVDNRTSVTHLRLQQTAGGVDVYGARIRAAIHERGALYTVSAATAPAPALRADLEAPRITRAAAIRAAAAHLGINMRRDPNPVDAAADDQHRRQFEKTEDLQRPIETQFVYFPLTARTLRPAYSILISERNSADVYEVLVDAVDSAILKTINHTVYEGPAPASYRVFTSDSPAPMTPGPDTPDGSQAPIVSRELIMIDALDPIASPDGWIASGENETLGNNVDAHLDLNNDDDPDLPRPQGSPFRVFDFPIDFGQDPDAYQDAAVTQMFYWTNWFHDRLHQLGFTEQFSNFQEDNFGRGGVGGDPISADVQDGGDINNANFFSLPQDGFFSRVQMYLWPGPSPTRDGALDGQIIIHELAHGLTIRLAGPLNTTQSRGLGEGWSDFYALALLAEPDDDQGGIYTVGGYSTFEGVAGFDENYYFGIRRYPYTTDQSRNPVTFNDIDPDQFDVSPSVPRNPAFGSSSPSQVHNIGTVWCSMLWDCRARFIDRYGFAGNEIFLQLTVDALKITPFNPDFIQARDAILLADIMTNNGENLCILWDGFAGRGLGAGASSIGSAEVAGVIEAFDTPENLAFDFSGDAPNRAEPGPAEISVRIFETCSELNTSSPTLNLSIDGAPFQQIPLAQDGAHPTLFIAQTPALACGQSVRYYISAEADGVVSTDPPEAPSDVYSLAVATADELRFADDFETDLGWTVSGDASDGQWERAFPMGFGDRGDPYTDADGSGFCFVTDNEDGNSDVDDGETILTSPLLDAAGGRPLLTYARWYSNNYGANPGTDIFTVQASNNNGADWTTIETVSDSAGVWVFRSVLLDEFLAPTDQMRVRFIASDLGEGAIVEAGVDAVQLEILTCATNSADITGDGVVNSSDLAALLGAWGPCPAEGPCPADVTGDGAVDSADLAALLGNWD